jgi:hypothetical protein
MIKAPSCPVVLFEHIARHSLSLLCCEPECQGHSVIHVMLHVQVCEQGVAGLAKS